MSITVDSTTEPVNLIWYCGDNQSQTFRFLTAQDEPWDLTGVFVRSQARSTLGKVTDLTVGIDDPTTGVVSLHPPLGGLDPDLYDYDIQFNDGHATASWVHGRLQIRKDVTG
jgi:hypothetical protein